MRGLGIFILVSVGSLSIGGCASSGAGGDTLTPRPLPPGSALVEGSVERANSVEGRTIEARIMGSGPETVMLIGVIHGSEPVGEGLIARFLEEVDLNRGMLEGRRIVAVPVANPDGLARRTRQNAHGVDLNRNFPARNFAASAERGSAPLCEPESRFLADLITRYRPARILSIHQPLRCVNFDGPARDLASKMADACGYPVKDDIGYATPGSLGSWAGADLSIPIITLENGSSADVTMAFTRHRKALVLFLTGS